MRLASVLHLSLRACAQQTTHREYRTWVRWMQDEWNNPSRSDYYLMRISQRLIQTNSKTPDKHTLDEQKIPFGFGEKQDEPAQPKSRLSLITDFAKARWCALVGLKRS